MNASAIHAPLECHESRLTGEPLGKRVLRELRCWQQRARTRRQLAQLDERLLQDIGLRAIDARQEYLKPFWKP